MGIGRGSILFSLALVVAAGTLLWLYPVSLGLSLTVFDDGHDESWLRAPEIEEASFGDNARFYTFELRWLSVEDVRPDALWQALVDRVPWSPTQPPELLDDAQVKAWLSFAKPASGSNILGPPRLTVEEGRRAWWKVGAQQAYLSALEPVPQVFQPVIKIREEGPLVVMMARRKGDSVNVSIEARYAFVHADVYVFHPDAPPGADFYFLKSRMGRCGIQSAFDLPTARTAVFFMPPDVPSPAEPNQKVFLFIKVTARE